MLTALLAGPGPRGVAAQEAALEGEVRRGESWQAALGPGLRVELLPLDRGWQVRVGPAAEPGANWIVAEPRPLGSPASSIEGWQFRNADNSGPREAGPSEAQAPARARTYRFGPPIRGLNGPSVDAALTGEITFRITALELGGLAPGARAHIERMAFTLEARCLRTGCLDGPAEGVGR